MTSILLFSRKIYSCFHWDCIVDAKRVDVTRNVLRKKLLLKSGSSHYCTFGTVLATNLIQNEVDGTASWQGYDGSSVFTTTMFTASRVASNISSAQRSLYMLLGCSNRIFIFDSNTSYSI
jgi:hypothetical protein